jgi:hypothetical protein
VQKRCQTVNFGEGRGEYNGGRTTRMSSSNNTRNALLVRAFRAFGGRFCAWGGTIRSGVIVPVCASELPATHSAILAVSAMPCLVANYDSIPVPLS